MGSTDWKSVQQDAEREICLGNRYGWQGLSLLNKEKEREREREKGVQEVH